MLVLTIAKRKGIMKISILKQFINLSSFFPLTLKKVANPNTGTLQLNLSFNHPRRMKR